MRCSACQHENDLAARFCSQCGAPLGETAIPQSTGRFCIHCGQPVTSADSRGAPGSYTPKHLADRILTSRSALEGERKMVTVLFADVENFTRLGERLDAEVLHELMDRVFAILLESIHRYEGTINQFTGDGVMALFGAPVALEDHALRAVEAALEVQRTMASKAAEFQASFSAAPQLRIGLNTGRVVVGKIGDDLRMDYTAQGDTVNLAARLQALAEAGTVAMSPSTQRLVTGRVKSNFLGRHKVKGKEEPIDVFRPVRVFEQTMLDEAGAGLWAPLVGRDTELERLMSVFETVRAGQPRAVVLLGEAGIGKSRLLQEFRERLGEGVRWLAGHAVPYGRATPFRPILETLRSIFRITAGDSEQVALEKIDQVLGAHSDEAIPARSAIRWLLGLGPPDQALAILSAADRKLAVTRALDTVFRLCVADVPHVLLIDACQWLDPESEAYLAHLLAETKSGTILFAFATRPGGPSWEAASTTAERIVLGALTPVDTRLLVAQIAPGLTSKLIDLVLERGGGNPLFLEEVARAVRDTGAADIPPTIEGVLMARVDRLPVNTKSVLQAASVIGREVSQSVLAEVVDDPASLPAALDGLVEHGFLQKVEHRAGILTWQQPLVLEVAMESLLKQTRKTLHYRVGKALEQFYGSRALEHAEDLARHFSAADDWSRAVQYSREAGRKAASLSANTQAVAWFERALDSLSRLPNDLERSHRTIEIQMDLCRAKFQIGQLDEVLLLARQAETLAQTSGDEQRLGQVYAYLSNYHYMKGEPEQAIEYGRRGLRLGGAEPDAPLRRSIRQYLGTALHALGEYETAHEILTEQVASLERSPNHLLIGGANLSYVSSCGWLAFTLADLARFQPAAQMAERGMRAARQGGHPYAEAIALAFVGLVRHAQGDDELALPNLEASLRLCNEHQLTVWLPVSSALLGHALAVDGKVESGLALLRQSLMLHDQLGVQAYRALWTAYLAEALLLRGQLTEALLVGRQALELALKNHEQGNQARVLQVIGTIQAHADPSEFVQADRNLRQSLEQAERMGLRPLVGACHCSLALLARQRGEVAAATESFARARALGHEIGMRFWQQRFATRSSDSCK